MWKNEMVKNSKISNAPSKPGRLYLNELRKSHTEMKQPEYMKRAQCNEVAVDLMEEYGQKTTIHGLNRAFAPKASKAERLLWSAGFLVALSFLIYVSLIIADRYNRRTFKTVVENTDYPVYKIAFPEVTICNNNRLNWQRFEEAKRRYLLPEHRTSEYEELFALVLTLYDTFAYGEFERFEQLNNKPLEALNYINFTNVVGLMAWHCREFLVDCWWRRHKVDCCEIFIKRRSQLGFCWAFNSIEGVDGMVKMFLDAKWPWRVSEQDAGSGLMVKMLVNEELHSPFAQNEKGSTFMVAEPSVWSSYPMKVRLLTRTKVKLGAVISIYDNETRRVPSKVRECVFADERQSLDFKTLVGHEYMFENCQSECEQEYLMRFCNCTVDLFYPVGHYPPCKLVDLPCLAKHNDRLLYFENTGEEEFVSSRVDGMICTCFLNCYSMSYTTVVRSSALQPEERVLNRSYIDMDFFFSSDRIMVYKTTLVYTWVDLIASFGGVTSLFLGCSLISVIEVIYFFFVKVPQRVCKEKHKSSMKLKEKRDSQWQSVKTLLEQQKEKY